MCVHYESTTVFAVFYTKYMYFIIIYYDVCTKISILSKSNREKKIYIPNDKTRVSVLYLYTYTHIVHKYNI